MQSVQFHETNIALAKDQEQYNTLHVNVDTTVSERPVTAKFELTEEEIQTIIANKCLWYTQWTFGDLFHPMSIQVDCPFPNL
jgi:hypothetical protein